MSFITGAGHTAYGRREGCDTLALMSEAAQAALDDAGLVRGDIDGLITGYSTTLPHLMLSTVFAEHFGLAPDYAHAIQLGGATGFAMVMLAHRLVEAGAARNILVVAGGKPPHRPDPRRGGPDPRPGGSPHLRGPARTDHSRLLRPCRLPIQA